MSEKPNVKELRDYLKYLHMNVTQGNSYGVKKICCLDVVSQLEKMEASIRDEIERLIDCIEGCSGEDLDWINSRIRFFKKSLGEGIDGI